MCTELFLPEEDVWSSSPVLVSFSNLARPFDIKIQLICRNVTYILKHENSFV